MTFGDYITFTIIYTVIVILGGFILKNLLPSYFNQKGKNLADKEDIAELTKRIESVKQDFSKDIESFKNKLSYEREYKMRQKIEERDAIYDFWSNICEWNANLAVHKYEDTNFETYKVAKINIDQLNKCIRNTTSSHSIILLKVDNEKILEISNLLFQIYNSLMKDVEIYFNVINEIQDNICREELLTEHREILKNELAQFYKTNKAAKDIFILRVKEYLNKYDRANSAN